jgi:hypothetical protein
MATHKSAVENRAAGGTIVFKDFSGQRLVKPTLINGGISEAVREAD